MFMSLVVEPGFQTQHALGQHGDGLKNIVLNSSIKLFTIPLEVITVNLHSFLNQDINIIILWVQNVLI